MLRKALNLLKYFLQRILNRQFLIFLFFLVLSAAFWMFQALEEDYEKEFSIPLRLKNVPENVVVTTDLPNALRVVLKDRGVTLLQYMYGSKLSVVVVDFNECANYSGHVRLLGSDLQKQIAAQLENSTRLISIKPDTVDFYYNYGGHKRVPVRIQGEVNADTRYNISHVRLKPDSVVVYAISSVLDTITAAYTSPLYLRNLRDTTETDVPFRTVRGAKFVPSKSHITFFVDQMTEKTVQVPVQWVNFPASKTLRTFPQKVSITFQVGAGMYRRIGPDHFVIVVNYEELMRDTTGRCRLQLKTIPAGASHVRIVPNQVDFLIEDAPAES